MKMNRDFLPSRHGPYNQRPPESQAGQPEDRQADQLPAVRPYQGPPLSTLPVTLPSRGQPPAQPPQQQQPQWYNAPFLARPAQAIRGWSNKMAALRRPAPPAQPHPPLRYGVPQPMP